MKTYIFLLLFILASSASFAQSFDDGLFHSIDGNGWATEKERDDQEADLEADIIDDMITILTKDNSKADLCGAIKDSQTLALHEIKKLRHYDREMRKKLTPEILALLNEKGVDLSLGKANDNEIFCLVEIARLADVYIRQYWFYTEWVQAMMKGEAYSDDFSNEIDNNTSMMAKDIQTANDKLLAKVKLIEKVINTKSTEEKDLKPTDENKTLYYSLDGCIFGSKKEYVDRNTILCDSLKQELNKLVQSRLVDEKLILALNNTLSTTFTQAELLQTIMDAWKALKDSEEALKDITDFQPDADLDKVSTVYYMRSETAKKETPPMPEIVDAYNCLCSIYSVSTKTMDEVNETIKQNKEAGSGNANEAFRININFDEQTNEKGQNILSLFKEYLLLIDQIEAKFEKEKENK